MKTWKWSTGEPYYKSARPEKTGEESNTNLDPNYESSIIRLPLVKTVMEKILEYIDNVQTQLNYIQEAENTILLKEKWKSEETVIVPEIYGFSSDIIIMSYHDGDNYNNLTKKQQLITSLHMNYIFLTSMLVHDFIHGDLHTGNWKITFNPMRIILYDCGIMCKTGDLEFNKQFMRVLFSGNYLDLLDFICHENTPAKEICKKYFQEKFVDCSTGRLKMFINKLLEMS